jgi:hypothetical protein
MATVSISYRASSTITIAPENVASSSTFVAGVESAVYDNTSNKDVDVLIAGTWTAGTTPTINTQVNIYVFGIRDDAPFYPDVMDGTSSAETVTSAGVGQGFLKLGAVLNVDATTSNRVYDCGPFSVAQLFGGVCPNKFGIFISHNTGVNSNSTAGNHVWKATGISYTVA